MGKKNSDSNKLSGFEDALSALKKFVSENNWEDLKDNWEDFDDDLDDFDDEPPVAEESNVSIVSHSLSKNSLGQDILIIEYSWTNTCDIAASFIVSVQAKVFQNGIECSSAMFCDEVDSRKKMTNVKPGITYNIKEAYVLQDMTNAHVVVTKSWSNGKVLIDETIELGGGEGKVISVDQSRKTSLRITDHYLTKDYKDKDVLIIEYEFYNGEDDAIAFIHMFNNHVFQNGIECDSKVFGCDDETTRDIMKNIQPGITITVRKAYHIDDMSDVSVEATKLFGKKIYLSETITLS